MQAGFIWEIALEYAFKEFMKVQRKVEKQLHLELDQILMTPDGFNTEAWELEEYKTTAKSMKKWEEDFMQFWLWMVQTQAYLYALSQREGKPVDTVRFFIWFWYGDYSKKPGRGRQMVETAIRFTGEELERNWQSVLRYKAWIEEKRNAGGN